MKKITAKRLENLFACAEQVARFRKLFPQGVVPTRALCIKHAGEFEWGWAARHLLSATAQAEYRRAIEPAQVEYDRDTAPALAKYIHLTFRWAEYKRATAPAWLEYERATAAAFADAAKLK